jgi:hypothetical protein
MAKIEIPDSDSEGKPTSLEEIEIRPWGIAGARAQQFYIGSGLNFCADGNIWLEIVYTVQGAQLFYTRNFLHYSGDGSSTPALMESLEKFISGEYESFGFGDMLPETGVSLKREQFTDEENTYTSYHLEVSVDTGAVFGMSSPGERMINIVIKDIPLDQGVQFMRDLIDEIEAAYQSRRPDPASINSDASD